MNKVTELTDEELELSQEEKEIRYHEQVKPHLDGLFSGKYEVGIKYSLPEGSNALEIRKTILKFP